jgi:hypothetical protein
MKIQIKSIFEQISEKVFQMTSLTEAKEFTVNFVNDKSINDKDKQLILKAVNEAKSMTAFQRYICNSLLKYEGLGANQMQKTAKEAASETAFE